MQIESFDGQREDEDILAVWRPHPWTLAKPAMIAILIIAFGSLPLAFSSYSWSFKFLLFFGAIAGLYFINFLYNWLNTLYIFTNQRLFSIEQGGLFSRANNEVPLKNIQNVSHRKKGIFQMMLNYGNIEVQTAGATTAMTLKNIENPYKVQQKILG